MPRFLSNGKGHLSHHPQWGHSVHPAHAHCSPNHILRALNCVPCPIYYCSMHLARHARASSWHAVEHALSWLLRYRHQIALLFVSGWVNAVHQASVWLNVCCTLSINNYSSLLRIKASVWLNFVVSCIHNCDSMLHVHPWHNAYICQASICSSMLCIRHQI